MRLSTKELSTIKRAFAEVLLGRPFQLYLYGSRTDDTKKGGDIDLLLVVPTELKSDVIELKTKIRCRIFDFIDEQKIDITVATENELSSDIFLSSVKADCIVLEKRL